jgi:hypothetical protein
MRAAGFILALFAVLALRFFVQDRYKTAMASAVAGATTSCITMGGNTTREIEGSTYIVGTIKNDCNRRFSNVTVVFKVDGELDSKMDRREAIFYAYERDLAPGETRNFKTMFQIRKDATYRFDRITGY